jgi:hypothetical protein
MSRPIIIQRCPVLPNTLSPRPRPLPPVESLDFAHNHNPSPRTAASFVLLEKANKWQYRLESTCVDRQFPVLVKASTMKMFAHDRVTCSLDH